MKRLTCVRSSFAGRKKGSRGKKDEWSPLSAEPRIPLSPLSYLEREGMTASFLERTMREQSMKEVGDATEEEQG